MDGSGGRTPSAGSADICRCGCIGWNPRRSSGRLSHMCAPPCLAQTRSRMTTGIWRLVFCSYSAKPGMNSFWRVQIRSRSSPSATRARFSTVSMPISTVTTGLALRLWNQSGLVSAPPLEAKMATSSPTGWYATGLTRSLPVLAPRVWRRSTFAPSNGPPTLPSLARNSSMILAFQSFISLIVQATSLRRQLFRPTALRRQATCVTSPGTPESSLALLDEVGLAELADVDDAVFRTQELFVVELPGRLKDVRPRCQLLRGAAVAFDCVDPGPRHQYGVVVRRVRVHACLEPAAWLLQQHAERTFFVIAPQDRKLNGCAGMHVLPREVGDRHGDLLLAFCNAGRQTCDARNVLCFIILGNHLCHLLINWIRCLSFTYSARASGPPLAAPWGRYRPPGPSLATRRRLTELGRPAVACRCRTPRPRQPRRPPDRRPARGRPGRRPTGPRAARSLARTAR